MWLERFVKKSFIGGFQNAISCNYGWWYGKPPMADVPRALSKTVFALVWAEFNVTGNNCQT
jgi:hypothetical protein